MFMLVLEVAGRLFPGVVERPGVKLSTKAEFSQLNVYRSILNAASLPSFAGGHAQAPRVQCAVRQKKPCFFLNKPARAQV